MMKIAVLSGKGGTGKTTVSNNLAALNSDAILLDCDVEEPNSHIFMNPRIKGDEDVAKDYPVIDEEKCVHCGECARFCHYNAIISGPSATITMKEICHSCRGCALVCQHDAITYKQREIGKIYSGTSRFGTELVYGELKTGELSGVPIINKIREMTGEEHSILIDSPPGTACSTVAAVEDCDYALIVTEPTPFGVSDMKMVVEMLRTMKIPFSVIINKAWLGDREVYDYCREENLEILGEIPFDRDIAEAYSTGKLIVECDPKYEDIFQSLWNKIHFIGERIHGC